MSKLSKSFFQECGSNYENKRMYGVGGTSEVCYEQQIFGLYIEKVPLDDFSIQLGSIQEPYGFDGIIGIDFMIKSSCKVNFETMTIELEH